MLLAEIHGKRFPEAEGQEDWLTSAVFGNLRHIQPSVFWNSLFSRAQSVGDKQASLASELKNAGVRFERFTELTTTFWKTCLDYGEPDLILRFTGPTVRPLIVLVEVKLNSTKSSTGQNDQLARYLALLDDPAALPAWRCPEDRRYLVYLTRAFVTQELQESIAASAAPDAAKRMFGLEWRDVLETAKDEGGQQTLLYEIAEFLIGRGFEAFRGFREPLDPAIVPKGAFYRTAYFQPSETPLWMDGSTNGKFYGI